MRNKGKTITITSKDVKKDSENFIKRMKHLSKLKKEGSVPHDVLMRKIDDAAKAAKRLRFRRGLIDGRNKKGHSGN